MPSRALQRPYYGPVRIADSRRYYSAAAGLAGGAVGLAGVGKYLLSKSARAAGRYAWSKYSSKGKSSSLSASAKTVGESGSRAKMYKGRIGGKRKRFRKGKRKWVSCNKLAKKLRKLEHMAKQSIATYKVVEHIYQGSSSSANQGNSIINQHGQFSDINALLESMPVLDNTVTPNVYNMEDFTNNGAGEVMCTIISEITYRNNSNAPVVIQVINFRPKGSRGTGPITLIDNDMADQPLAITSPTSSFATNYLMEAHDRRWATMHRNWSFKKIATVTLQPGDQYSTKIRSSCVIDLNTWDNDTASYHHKLFCETVCRFRGVISHDDTTVTNVGIAPAYLDQEKKETIYLKFEAPAHYIYESRSYGGDTLTTPKANPGLSCPSVTVAAD